MRHQRNTRFNEFIRSESVATLAFATFAALLLSLLFVRLSLAQEQAPRAFHSPEEAGSALFAAAQNEDDKALVAILGPASREIISSGDPTRDMNERESFVVKYEEMHRYVKAGNGTTVVYVGAENWPFPIPLVNDDGAWHFDTEAGKEEILMRRVGQNELAAIDACHQLVDAEKKFKANAPQRGSAGQYTQNFVSDPGQHNGLSWPEAGTETQSFLDPLIASAGLGNEKSSDDASGDPMPFNGYFFRILQRQGQNAPGGAKSYIANGKMVGGFAFVAYPAEYRASGVMTFIVNKRGVVYEKDLGPNTSTIATTMTDFDPDSTWHQIN